MLHKRAQPQYGAGTAARPQRQAQGHLQRLPQELCPRGARLPRRFRETIRSNSKLSYLVSLSLSALPILNNCLICYSGQRNKGVQAEQKGLQFAGDEVV